MKERKDYKLPAEVGNRYDGFKKPSLPDWVPLRFSIDSDDYHIEVSSRRVKWFKKNYPKQIGKNVEWVKKQFTI